MAYNEFAYFYDEFNGEADYDALYEHIQKELAAHGIADGIVADLGCGTGELTLMLTQAFAPGWGKPPLSAPRPRSTADRAFLQSGRQMQGRWHCR